MELNIDDFDFSNNNFGSDFGSDIDLTKINFDIPTTFESTTIDNIEPVYTRENKINVIKQNIVNANHTNVRPKSILKQPLNSNPNIKLEKRSQKRVSYDDILAQMGMCINNGRLQRIDKTICNDDQKCAREIIREYNSKPQQSQVESIKQQPQINQNPQQQQPRQQQQQQVNANITINPNLAQQNSYIYNKYFKDQIQSPVQQAPQTLEEYNQMLIQKLIEQKIQKLRAGQMKSTKLIMPTENIHIASQNSNNMNRLFNFSQR